MKNILYLILLIPWLSISQENYLSVSSGLDIKNAVLGSNPTNNKPAMDLTINLHMVSNNFELSPGIEYFPKIGFTRQSVDFGYHIDRYIPMRYDDIKIVIIPQIGTSLINRYGFEDKEIIPNKNNPTGYVYGKSSHIAYQIELSFRHNLSDKFIIDITSQLMSRPDLIYRYSTDNPKSFVLSNFIKLHYIIK